MLTNSLSLCFVFVGSELFQVVPTQPSSCGMLTQQVSSYTHITIILKLDTISCMAAVYAIMGQSKSNFAAQCLASLSLSLSQTAFILSTYQELVH